MKTRALVDSIDRGVARLVAGKEVARVPARLLPEGAVEGSWVEIAIERAEAEAPEPDDTEERRRKLAASDDGGDLEL